MCSQEHTASDDRLSVRSRGNGEWIFSLGRDWTLERPAPDAASVLPAEWDGVARLRFEDASLGSWDSSLILFLLRLADQAEARGVKEPLDRSHSYAAIPGATTGGLV